MPRLKGFLCSKLLVPNLFIWLLNFPALDTDHINCFVSFLLFFSLGGGGGANSVNLLKLLSGARGCKGMIHLGLHLYIHAYLHTHTYTPAHTHTHTHTPTQILRPSKEADVRAVSAAGNPLSCAQLQY